MFNATLFSEIVNLVNRIVKNYVTDFGHDVKYMFENEECTRFMWIPRENGTHIARIDSVCKHAYDTYEAYMLDNVFIIDLTKQTITKTNKEELKKIFSDLPNPRYKLEYIYKNGSEDSQTFKDIDQAQKTFQQLKIKMYWTNIFTIRLLELETKTTLLKHSEETSKELELKA